MADKGLTMAVLGGKFGVCRLEKGSPIPGWAAGGEFFSVTGTSDELSVVCGEESIPMDIKCEKGWRVLKILGPLDFSLVGILASVSAVLARAKISIFAVSTYDTDYILVKDTDLLRAMEELNREGYVFIC